MRINRAGNSNAPAAPSVDASCGKPPEDATGAWYADGGGGSCDEEGQPPSWLAAVMVGETKDAQPQPSGGWLAAITGAADEHVSREPAMAAHVAAPESSAVLAMAYPPSGCAHGSSVPTTQDASGLRGGECAATGEPLAISSAVSDEDLRRAILAALIKHDNPRAGVGRRVQGFRWPTRS